MSVNLTHKQFNMQRRKFMQQSLLASGGLFTSANVLATNKKLKTTDDSKPFNLNYAIHDGMFENHAGKDFIEQIKFAHSIGFRAIEDNGMMARPVAQQKLIGDTLAKLNMAMGVFVITSD